MAVDLASISGLITAVGALGTASYGLVDATKSLGGGISLCGLANIHKAIAPLFDGKTDKSDFSTALTFGSIYANLKANWMNGRALDDQKAIAKTLLKLRLDEGNAAAYAKLTGVDAATLAQIAKQINSGLPLAKDSAQADAFGRFDLALTSLLDEAYQRADQRYRNGAKVLAGAFSIVIAVAGGAMYFSSLAHPATATTAAILAPEYWGTAKMALAFLAGALATPLAPIAKDLTSALAAGVNVAQKMAK